ncbi:hypothetical protein EBB79_19070 [Parasedimentitalea marina]|uniref:Uncharacterized protein n=1 Tax=Parasedimentitalea marina TaxID=2483033 RepID=A0A3T0N6W6_9RHOB|nr:hypothetical protein EBB79_19070 [Parasedimentitalea marina]
MSTKKNPPLLRRGQVNGPQEESPQGECLEHRFIDFLNIAKFGMQIGAIESHECDFAGTETIWRAFRPWAQFFRL